VPARNGAIRIEVPVAPDNGKQSPASSVRPSAETTGGRLHGPAISAPYAPADANGPDSMLKVPRPDVDRGGEIVPRDNGASPEMSSR